MSPGLTETLVSERLSQQETLKTRESRVLRQRFFVSDPECRRSSLHSSSSSSRGLCRQRRSCVHAPTHIHTHLQRGFLRVLPHRTNPMKLLPVPVTHLHFGFLAGKERVETFGSSQAPLQSARNMSHMRPSVSVGAPG